MIIKELPLHYLLDCIFSDNEMLLNCQLIKQFPGPDYRPEKIHKVLGELLKALDTEEALCHVEIYPTHAQVMRKYVWDDSNEKQFRGSAASIARTIEIDAMNSKILDLVKALSEMSGYPPGQCFAKAQDIYRHKNQVVASILGVQL